MTDEMEYYFDYLLWMDRITRLVRETHEMVGGYPSHHWVLVREDGDIMFGREPGTGWEVLQ